MQLPIPTNLKTRPRADFDPRQFDKMLFGHGSRLLWEQGERCPCTTDEGSPRTDCPICHGKHWHYHDSQEIRGIVAQIQDAPRLWEEFGDWGFGVVRISLPWQHNPGYNDRFTLLDGRMLRQEIVTHEATADSPYWPIRKTDLTLLVNGRPQTVSVSVRYCRVLDPAGTGIGGPTREIGVDFEVDADGRIDWTLGEGLATAPGIGERYALGYYASPRWVSMEHPFGTRQTDTQSKAVGQQHQALPVLTMARLDWWATKEAA